MKGYNVSPEFTKDFIANIFAEGELATLEEHDVTLIYHRMKHFRQCYIHGLDVGQLEHAQELVAGHNIKLVPVLHTPEVPEHHRVNYCFVKATNMPDGCSEDVYSLFKGWVDEDSHIYPLYNDDGTNTPSCYTAMSYETFTKAKPELEATNNINLSILSNTIHARSAIRDIERLSKEHVMLIRDLPSTTTLSDLYAFLDPLVPAWVQKIEDYWFVTFEKGTEAVAAFENVDWMKGLGEEVQLKYLTKMRKFSPSLPFRFFFWKHNGHDVSTI